MMTERDESLDRKEQKTNDYDPDLPENTLRIRILNDGLRRLGHGGLTMLTRELRELPEQEVIGIIRAVAAFDGFTPDNDPHGEHDCAILNVGRHRIIWKIDYYDTDLNRASPNPADPKLTRRVLTIMLATEY